MPHLEAPSLVGQVLDNRYKITRKLGEGGMGEVYAADHVHIEKKFAIKLLRPEIVSNPEAVSGSAGSAVELVDRAPQHHRDRRLRHAQRRSHLHVHGAPQRSCLERSHHHTATGRSPAQHPHPDRTGSPPHTKG
jgi:serine/threonine protein kinase